MASKQIAVLISGSGSNFKAIHKACKDGFLDCSIGLVLADRSSAAGLKYADQEGLAYKVLRPRDYPDYRDWDQALADELERFGIDLVILAGFLRKIGPAVLAAFPGKILNIHPSLLPKYGGAGCYGIKPHELAIGNGDLFAGATVHIVDDQYDQGPIILQEKLQILPGESPEELQARVLSEIEWKIYAQAIKLVLERMV